ncbi:hypothetical protein [Streptomyces brasiliensis]|uniref:hypothetical protein n=1 Tax=Streptomyces brasiliensis TaxID=1954 RepID=UPI0016706493|nr:hypothetical protein [Streptomyces brasiliensis]
MVVRLVLPRLVGLGAQLGEHLLMLMLRWSGGRWKSSYWKSSLNLISSVAFQPQLKWTASIRAQ